MESASTGSTGTRQELVRLDRQKASTAPRQRPRQRLDVDRAPRCRSSASTERASTEPSESRQLTRARQPGSAGCARGLGKVAPPRRAPAPPRRPTWENSKRPVTHDLNIQSAFAGLVACGNCYYVRTIEHTTYGRRQQLSHCQCEARRHAPGSQTPSIHPVRSTPSFSCGRIISPIISALASSPLFFALASEHSSHTRGVRGVR
jgi:hypothetical protein